MTGNFDLAFDKTMKHEGKYADNPNDRGGETYAGISRKFHPNWSGWIHIDLCKNGFTFPNNIDYSVLLPDIKSFYYENYWNKIRLNEIKHFGTQAKLFDIAVNCGNSKAVEILQTAINFLNVKGFLGNYLKVDSKIGKKTLSALQIILNKQEQVYLLTAIKALQGAYYIDITQARPSQRVFSRNWILRSTK